jgi:hypothetical protein
LLRLARALCVASGRRLHSRGDLGCGPAWCSHLACVLALACPNQVTRPCPSVWTWRMCAAGSSPGSGPGPFPASLRPWQRLLDRAPGGERHCGHVRCAGFGPLPPCGAGGRVGQDPALPLQGGPGPRSPLPFGGLMLSAVELLAVSPGPGGPSLVFFLLPLSRRSPPPLSWLSSPCLGPFLACGVGLRAPLPPEGGPEPRPSLLSGAHGCSASPVLSAWPRAGASTLGGISGVVLRGVPI